MIPYEGERDLRDQLPRPEQPPRVAQRAKLDSKAQPIVRPSPTDNDTQVIGSERPVTHQVGLVFGQGKQQQALRLGQNGTARHLSGSAGRRPANPRQRVDQRRARYTEVAAYSRFAGAAFEGDGNRRDLLRVDRGRPTAAPTPAPGGCQPRHDPFARQGAFVLGECAEHREQQLALRGCRIHMFGQGSESDATLPKISDNIEKMR
ncbi:hypothetical protein NBRC3280_3457 [Acetobacter pasteurianus NBRC 3280]|nr:hypothetical protein NBRC3280_3457 [Acetobacter pasteurianus NBRC 3280]